MRMIYIVATYAGTQPLIDHDALIAALQRAADQERGGLEHARVHASGAGISGVLFFSEMTPDVAQIYCRELFEQVVLSNPKLTSWSLSHCDVLPMT